MSKTEPTPEEVALLKAGALARDAGLDPVEVLTRATTTALGSRKRGRPELDLSTGLSRASQLVDLRELESVSRAADTARRAGQDPTEAALDTLVALWYGRIEKGAAHFRAGLERPETRVRRQAREGLIRLLEQLPSTVTASVVRACLRPMALDVVNSQGSGKRISHRLVATKVYARHHHDALVMGPVVISRQLEIDNSERALDRLFEKLEDAAKRSPGAFRDLLLQGMAEWRPRKK